MQYDLAVHYLFDKQLDENNVEQAPDYAEAFKWLKQSAEGGNKEACTLLGLMYERGRGTPLDSEKAKYWFKKAREK